MLVHSAGILMIRFLNNQPKFLCILGGNPTGKADKWSLPKGVIENGEEPINAAMREFSEETGLEQPPKSELIPLGSFLQRCDKIVHMWMYLDQNNNKLEFNSNTVSFEYPKNSGKIVEFKEAVDHQFLSCSELEYMLLESQQEFIIRALERLRLNFAKKKKHKCEKCNKVGYTWKNIFEKSQYLCQSCWINIEETHTLLSLNNNIINDIIKTNRIQKKYDFDGEYYVCSCCSKKNNYIPGMISLPNEIDFLNSWKDIKKHILGEKHINNLLICSPIKGTSTIHKYHSEERIHVK